MAEQANGESPHRVKGQQAMLASQRAKVNGEAEQTRTKRLPMSYTDGFSQWWANISPAVAENKVLSFVPFLQQAPTHMQTGGKCHRNPANTDSGDDTSQSMTLSRQGSVEDPYGPRMWHSSLVKLAGKDRALNEFSVERVGEEVDNDLVMLHGYGAGLGFFYKNFEPLSRAPNWRLYALDLLGMGRSSRPPFRIDAKDHDGKIAEAENWFADSLEEWRKQKNIDRFTLLGHSLGGYMAVAYALKYPGHLKKLILASPVGIPEDPYAVNAELPDPDTSTIQAEVSQDQSAATNGAVAQANGEQQQPRRRRLPGWVRYLWDANISPFSFVRWSGPLGPKLVSGWTSRRFSMMPPLEAQALHDYAYSLFRQRGSGEYALSYILAPGAFARSPLIRRVGGIGRQLVPGGVPGEEAVRERGIPVVFIYGDSDWMDVDGGYSAADKIREAREEAIKGLSKEDRRRDQGSAKVVVVSSAGHHVYLDGWEEFNALIRREMEDVEHRDRNSRSVKAS